MPPRYILALGHMIEGVSDFGGGAVGLRANVARPNGLKSHRPPPRPGSRLKGPGVLDLLTSIAAGGGEIEVVENLLTPDNGGTRPPTGDDLREAREIGLHTERACAPPDTRKPVST